MSRVDDAGPKVRAARQLYWYCELCERMHPIGAHDPGVSWPTPAEPAPQPPRSGQSAEPALRCLCGISLWATEETTKPNVWTRHIAHIEAWRLEIQRAFDQAIRELDEIRVYLDTDVWVSWLPGSWHDDDEGKRR